MTDSKIIITPPIRGTREAHNPQWIDLSMKVELPDCAGDIEEISEADRVSSSSASVASISSAMVAWKISWRTCTRQQESTPYCQTGVLMSRAETSITTTGQPHSSKEQL